MSKVTSSTQIVKNASHSSAHEWARVGDLAPDMSMDQLAAIYDAAQTSAHVVHGMVCQPRFQIEGEFGVPNRAGELLLWLSENLFKMGDLVVEEAQRRKPSTRQEAEARHWLLLLSKANLADCLSEFAVAASMAARDNSQTILLEKNTLEHSNRRGRK